MGLGRRAGSVPAGRRMLRASVVSHGAGVEQAGQALALLGCKRRRGVYNLPDVCFELLGAQVASFLGEAGTGRPAGPGTYAGGGGTLTRS